MVDEEIKRGEGSDADDDGEDGGTFWMMSASKQVKLVGTPQSLIAGTTDALRTASIDHSKIFEVMALLSAIRFSQAPWRQLSWVSWLRTHPRIRSHVNS